MGARELCHGDSGILALEGSLKSTNIGGLRVPSKGSLKRGRGSIRDTMRVPLKGSLNRGVDKG